MVASMTGYARESVEAPWGSATWEVRSVNHRFLDVSLRMPEELRALEGTARERVAARLKRGKVDCTLRLETRPGGGQGLAVNAALLEELLGALREVGERQAGLAPPSALDLLRWPGILDSGAPELDDLRPVLLTALDTAIGRLAEMREGEGAALGEGLASRCEQAGALVTRLRERIPDIIAEQTTRLKLRIDELAVDADPGRIEQEVALLSNRMDVAEEMDRLEAHIGEVARTLHKGEPVGRRLDFLLQEMNREANTIGSKSAHVDSTGISIELKVLIEQMREQVQNIE